MYFNEEKKHWEATQGYVFKRKDNEQLLSNVLYLGINDTIANYEEVLPEVETSE